GHLDRDGERGRLEEAGEMIASRGEDPLAGRASCPEVPAVAHADGDMHERVLGMSVRDAVRGGRVGARPETTYRKNSCSERRLTQCPHELGHIEAAPEVLGMLDDDVRHVEPRGWYLTSQISHCRPGEAKRGCART